MHSQLYTRHKREHARFLMHICVLAFCVCVRAKIFTEFLLQAHYYLINLSLEFYKDSNIGCRDICKILLMSLLIIDFQCIGVLVERIQFRLYYGIKSTVKQIVSSSTFSTSGYSIFAQGYEYLMFNFFTQAPFS